MDNTNQQIVDDKTLKGRYVFPGNLKLPVSIINGLSESEKTIIINNLKQLKARLSEELKGERAGCFKKLDNDFTLDM